MDDRYDDGYGDEYYDDEYYDDEYDDDGGRGFLLALVAVAAVGLLAVVFVVIVWFGGDRPEPSASPEPAPAPEAKTEEVAEVDPFGPMDSSAVPGTIADGLAATADGAAAAELDSGFDSVEPVAPVEEMQARGSQDSGSSWEEEPPRRHRPPPRSQRDRAGRSSGARVQVSTGSSSRSSSSSGRGSSSQRSSQSRREGSATKKEPAEQEPRVVGGQTGSTSKRGRPTMEFTKETVAALASKAGSGNLDDEQVRNLELIPDDNALFTQAWATLAKNAEAKKNYRGHCEACQKILSKPQNRYHPEWNLEMAKCQLRNKDYQGAVRSVDRTLGDPFGMAAATKVQRLMTAYEIKATSRTHQYDDHARSNSGLGDENKLNAAIQAWSEYRNFAAGVGDQMAQRRAEREIADLQVRKGK